MRDRYTLVSSGQDAPPNPIELRPYKDHDRPIVTEVYSTPGKSRPSPSYVSLIGRVLPFAGLILTTTLSLLLLLSAVRRWTTSGPFYEAVIHSRATTQLIVQVIATLLGLIHISAVCTLINYSSRISLTKRATSLDTVSFLHSLSIPYMDWNSPWKHLVPLLLFAVVINAVPAALWAGSITPVVTRAVSNTTMNVPSYTNTSSLVEYPSEIDRFQGPALRNSKGIFGYNAGMQNLGLLLSAASTATTVDGSPRRHSKYDYSQYLFVGRSYGVGSAVGLVDDHISAENVNVAYTFTEIGYATQVNCIYNASSDFQLSEASEVRTWAAAGQLPDSTNGGEYSEYISNSGKFVVAIGVAAAAQPSQRRYLAFATGESYSSLQNLQCSLDYLPTRFNISVNLVGRNITVTPFPDDSSVTVANMEPSYNLTHIVTRQFELIANDQTNLYTSLVGNSFNQSISSLAEYRQSLNGSGTTDTEESQTVLDGVSNAVSAMADDILSTYASAQVMIAQDTHAVEVVVSKAAVRFGQDIYIFCNFALNLVVILAVLVEVTRTRAWRSLPNKNIRDLRDVLVSTWQGAIAATVEGSSGREGGDCATAGIGHSGWHSGQEEMRPATSVSRYGSRSIREGDALKVRLVERDELGGLLMLER